MLDRKRSQSATSLFSLGEIDKGEAKNRCFAFSLPDQLKVRSIKYVWIAGYRWLSRQDFEFHEVSTTTLYKPSSPSVSSSCFSFLSSLARLPRGFSSCLWVSIASNSRSCSVSSDCLGSDWLDLGLSSDWSLSSSSEEAPFFDWSDSVES